MCVQDKASDIQRREPWQARGIREAFWRREKGFFDCFCFYLFDYEEECRVFLMTVENMKNQSKELGICKAS